MEHAAGNHLRCWIHSLGIPSYTAAIRFDADAKTAAKASYSKYFVSFFYYFQLHLPSISGQKRLLLSDHDYLHVRNSWHPLADRLLEPQIPQRLRACFMPACFVVFIHDVEDDARCFVTVAGNSDLPLEVLKEVLTLSLDCD